MDPKENEELLDLYTQRITVEALKNAEQYLENNLTGGRSVQKERLLAKVLAEEQKIDSNRKLLENLKTEQEGLNSELAKYDLKSLEVMQAERDELQRKRHGDKSEVSHKSIDEIQRLLREVEKIRNAIANNTEMMKQ